MCLIWGFKVDHMLWLNNSGTRARAFHSSLSRIVCFSPQETPQQNYGLSVFVCGVNRTFIHCRTWRIPIVSVLSWCSRF